jgi:lysozyme
MVKKHEGFRQFPYKCTADKLTIGYGFNLDDVGLSETESEVLLNMRLNELHHKMLQHEWYKIQNEARQGALLDMAYNLGITGLKKFRKMIRALSIGDFAEASVQALDSRWAVQVGMRAHTIADIIERGEY